MPIVTVVIWFSHEMDFGENTWTQKGFCDRRSYNNWWVELEPRHCFSDPTRGMISIQHYRGSVFLKVNDFGM